MTVTNICSIGIQTGSSVFTSLTNSAYIALRFAGSISVAASSMVLSTAGSSQPHWLVQGAPLGWPERYQTVVETAGSLRYLSLIHISEPTRLGMISYAVF